MVADLRPARASDVDALIAIENAVFSTDRISRRSFRQLIERGTAETLVAEVDGTLTVAVVPVAGSLDLKALAAAVGGKRAAMADPALAERTTGYVRGGISPLGQRKRLPTVLDDSAKAHATICVSAGRRGLEVELSPTDLADLTKAVLAPVGRA